MAEVLEEKINLKQVKKNVNLYVTGSAMSALGTYMYNFAIGLYVLKLTGSASSFSLAILFGMLPRVILSPFAGVLADKVDRKKMVISMDVLSGLLMLFVFTLTSMTTLTLVMIYASSALLTVFNTFFGISLNASIPNIVDEDHLMKINSLRATIDSSTSLVGPLLGGFVYALIGMQYFMLLNGISFLLSAFIELFIDFNVLKLKKVEAVKSSVLTSLKEGIIYLKEHKLLIGILKYVLILNFFAISITIVLPYTAVEILKATSAQYGIVQMGFPLGILVMSIVYGNLKHKEDKIFQRTSKNMLLFGGVFLLLALPTSPLLMDAGKFVNLAALFMISFLLGLVVIMINIPITTMMQKSIDDAYRGRVGGVFSMMAQSISPIGLIIFGLLLDVMSSYLMPLFCGLIILLIAVFMLQDKKMMTL